MQGAWALLLSHYSGEEDVVFGTVASGRPADLPGVESMVGLFINTLPVRLTVAPHAPLLDWLRQFQARQAEARAFEYTPLAEVQGWSEVPRGSRASLKATYLPSVELTSFPLAVVVGPGERIFVKLVFDAGRFDGATADGMLARLSTLLEEMVANAGGTVSSLSLLAEGEGEELTRGFTDDLEVF
jgi:non-ribosomal peptide synthetase component F